MDHPRHSDKLHVVVIGVGGVGGFFGGSLALRGGCDVTFVVRPGPHATALRTTGLRINDAGEQLVVAPLSVVDSAGDVKQPADVILLCTKLYDFHAAELTSLLRPPMMRDNTIVIPLHNGIRSLARLHPQLIGGTCYVLSSLAAPGHVVRRKGLQRLLFGPLRDQQIDTPLLESFQRCGNQAGFDCVLCSADMEREVWLKMISLSTASGMACIARVDMGTLLLDTALKDMVVAALQEAIKVTVAEGIKLDEQTEIDRAMTRWQSALSGGKPSMLLDLEMGRRLEVDYLSGTIERLGKLHGIHTPTHSLIVALLRPHSRGASNV